MSSMAQELHLPSDSWNNTGSVQCFAMPPSNSINLLTTKNQNHIPIHSPIPLSESYSDVDSALMISTGRMSTPSSSSSSCSSSSSSVPSYHSMSVVSNVATPSVTSQISPNQSCHNFMNVCEYPQPLPSIPGPTNGSATYTMIDYGAPEYSSQACTNDYHPTTDYSSNTGFIPTDYHSHSQTHSHLHHHQLNSSYSTHLHPSSIIYTPNPSHMTHLQNHDPSTNASSATATNNNMHSMAHVNSTLSISMPQPAIDASHHLHSLQPIHHSLSHQPHHMHPNQHHQARTYQNRANTLLPVSAINGADYAPVEVKSVEPQLLSSCPPAINYHQLTPIKTSSSSLSSSTDSIISDGCCSLMPPPPPSLLSSHGNIHFSDNEPLFHHQHHLSNAASVLQMPNSSLQSIPNNALQPPSIPASSCTSSSSSSISPSTSTASNGGPPRLNSPMVDDALTSLSWLQNLNMCMTRLGAPTPPASPIYNAALSTATNSGCLLQPVLGHMSKPRAERKLAKEGKHHKSPKISQSSSSASMGISLLASNNSTHSRGHGIQSGNHNNQSNHHGNHNHSMSCSNNGNTNGSNNINVDHNTEINTCTPNPNKGTSLLNSSSDGSLQALTTASAATCIINKRNKTSSNKKHRNTSSKKRSSLSSVPEFIPDVYYSPTGNNLSNTLGSIIEATLSNRVESNNDCKLNNVLISGNCINSDPNDLDFVAFEAQPQLHSPFKADKPCVEEVVVTEESIDYQKDPTIKPPFSYATLICMAMRANRNKMTLRAIYEWIHQNFLYYKNADPSWQVSLQIL